MLSLPNDLHQAADDGDVAAVKALLAEGHDPNAFDELAFTPLHYAASKQHLFIIRLLLEAGADVNAHDESRIGETPLGHVAGNCSLDVAKVLVAAGADPTIRGWMQLCALDRAKNRKRGDGPKVYALLCQVAVKYKTPPPP